MRDPYNQFAGRSLERIAALSDGLFAIAMTLLILEVHVPEPGTVHSEADLWRALVSLSPRFLTYLMSFITLGIFWHGQQAQLQHFDRADRDLSWINVGFLAAVSTMPFSTALLADFITYRAALVVYWADIFLLGAFLYASWTYAERAGLLKKDAPVEASRALKKRIIVAQTLYAFGALLCVISTYFSIGFIVLVQLNYALAPGWRRLGPGK